MDDDPTEWPCLDDRVTAYMAEHPECDLDDAIEALIWGFQWEKDDERTQQN